MMGLTIAVKPILAPLLLIALVRGQWKVFITSIGVPLVLTAIAWPLIADPMNFVRRTVPYLFESRDYFNSAIVGNAEYYGLPTGLTWAIRLIFAATVVVSLWLLYRYYRADELFFVTTTSGVLLAAVVPARLARADVLLDDAVPVPDDGGAAQLGAAQLARLVGDLRVHVATTVGSRRGSGPRAAPPSTSRPRWAGACC